jgi:hypothetical protein
MVSVAKDVALKAFAALIIIIVKELFRIRSYFISTAIYNLLLVIEVFLVLLLLSTAIMGLTSTLELVELEFSSGRDGFSKMKNQLHLYYLRLTKVGILRSRTISSVRS